jgi:hypothetical protein
LAQSASAFELFDVAIALRGRYFLDRRLCDLGFPRELQCLAIAAWNSVMDGDPNACGRLRVSGKRVAGLSAIDLSMRLIAPCPRVALDAESRRLHIACILAAPLARDGHRLARVISSLILSRGRLRQAALLDALKCTDRRRIAAVSVHQQYEDN